MAEMIPETINSAQRATAGEKRVFAVLRDGLQPDEEYIVWFEPKAIAKRPDFLLWAQDLGLLVIEVKDWVTSQIVEMSPDRWTIERNGKRESRESPLEQAHKCFIGYKELLQRDPLFRHAAGERSGNIKFPLGWCVMFTNITRAQATQFGITKVLPDSQCIFCDQLEFEDDDRNARRKFVSTLKQTFNAKFSFAPLSTDELKALRFRLFPEVRISAVRALRSSSDAELVEALDLQQERTAKSISDGHRILKGVAGSGKTLVIACRAKYLAQLNPDWRILVVCYNISLCRYLNQLIKLSGPNSDDWGIEIFYFHQLVQSLTGASLMRNPGESQQVWDCRVGTILIDAALAGKVEKYDAILIDEGQDFAVEWLEGLVAILNDKTDSLLLCIDPAQDIFGRRVSFKSVGIKVHGKRPVLLKTSYRNTVEILELARRFAKVTDASGSTDEDVAPEAVLFPLHTNRHGQAPILISGMTPEEQIRFVLDRIDEFIGTGQCSWADFGVLYTELRYFSFVEQFRYAFAARFGTDKLFWVTENRSAKKNLDLTSQSVKLSTIESAKGMEFRVVFLVGTEILPRPQRDDENERNLVYVGMTRAQDALYILGYHRSGFLRELGDLLPSTAISSAT